MKNAGNTSALTISIIQQWKLFRRFYNVHVILANENIISKHGILTETILTPPMGILSILLR
jgi:hypothetical protein